MKKQKPYEPPSPPVAAMLAGAVAAIVAGLLLSSCGRPSANPHQEEGDSGSSTQGPNNTTLEVDKAHSLIRLQSKENPGKSTVLHSVPVYVYFEGFCYGQYEMDIVYFSPSSADEGCEAIDQENTDVALDGFTVF